MIKVEVVDNKVQVSDVPDMSDEEIDIAIKYSELDDVLCRAYEQASGGKGHERHATDKAFEDQPMQLIQQLVGEGFALGQAIKKIQESTRMEKDAAVRELLGAINYIAGAIIFLEGRNE